MEEEIIEMPKSRVYILTDEDNNIIRIEGEYSLPEDLTGWILIEEDEPSDRLNHAQNNYLDKPLMDFEHGLYNYAYIDGEIVEKDLSSEIEEINEKRRVEDIRRRREEECFSIINRGAFWYQRLTDAQKEELESWYDQWLDAPQTMMIPDKPTWLD